MRQREDDRHERYHETCKERSGSRDCEFPASRSCSGSARASCCPSRCCPRRASCCGSGQDDLLGSIKAPVIGPFFQAMSAAGDAMFSNLPLLFAVGVAIGFAKKADGSTALAAVVGYLVVQAVFKTMSPIVLAGEVDKAGEQAQINYSVFAGIVVGLLTAWLFDRYHTIQLPSYLGFFGGRRFVPIVVSLACLFLAFAMSYFYPIFDAGLTGLGKFIGGSGAHRRLRLRLRQPHADSAGPAPHRRTRTSGSSTATTRRPTARSSPASSPASPRATRPRACSRRASTRS